VVVGGGVALLRALSSLDEIRLKGDEKIGLEILRQALKEPLKQIANNTGKMDGAVVVQKVMEGTGNFGYNAAINEFEDLVKTGVVDPAKVTRSKKIINKCQQVCPAE